VPQCPIAGDVMLRSSPELHQVGRTWLWSLKRELMGRTVAGFKAFSSTVTCIGSPYATGPLSVLSVGLSLCNVGLLWPNCWMDHDTTWYGGKPRPRQQCGPSSPMERGIAAPHFSAHVYCGQTIAHLSNC